MPWHRLLITGGKPVSGMTLSALANALDRAVRKESPPTLEISGRAAFYERGNEEHGFEVLIPPDVSAVASDVVRQFECRPLDAPPYTNGFRRVKL